MANGGKIGLAVRSEEDRTILAPSGDWTVRALPAVDADLRRLEAQVEPGLVTIDLSGLGRIDTAGAFALGRVLNRCGEPDGDFHFRGEHKSARRLMTLVRERFTPCPPPPAQGPVMMAICGTTPEARTLRWKTSA